MIRRPPRSTLSSSSAASDVYKRQLLRCVLSVAKDSIPYSLILRFRITSGLLVISTSTAAGRLANRITWKSSGFQPLMNLVWSLGPLLHPLPPTSLHKLRKLSKLRTTSLSNLNLLTVPILTNSAAADADADADVYWGEGILSSGGADKGDEDESAEYLTVGFQPQ